LPGGTGSGAGNGGAGGTAFGGTFEMDNGSNLTISNLGSYDSVAQGGKGGNGGSPGSA
jgi:hypothetical protein